MHAELKSRLKHHRLHWLLHRLQYTVELQCYDLAGALTPFIACAGMGAFSIAAMAEALEALLVALHLTDVHVVGYSLGARVALELCAQPG